MRGAPSSEAVVAACRRRCNPRSGALEGLGRHTTVFLLSTTAQPGSSVPRGISADAREASPESSVAMTWRGHQGARGRKGRKTSDQSIPKSSRAISNLIRWVGDQFREITRCQICKEVLFTGPFDPLEHYVAGLGGWGGDPIVVCLGSWGNLWRRKWYHQKCSGVYTDKA